VTNLIRKIAKALLSSASMHANTSVWNLKVYI